MKLLVTNEAWSLVKWWFELTRSDTDKKQNVYRNLFQGFLCLIGDLVLVVVIHFGSQTWENSLKT
jgi:hypothetical protein